MSDFFAMGGYAAFIWPAWGLSAAAVIGLVLYAMLERRASEK